MADITFTIPNNKLQRVKDGLLEIYPNDETIPDPAWVDPGDGTTAPQIPKYTDNQWLKERVRRFIIQSVKRGEEVIAQRQAKAALLDVDDLAS